MKPEWTNDDLSAIRNLKAKALIRQQYYLASICRELENKIQKEWTENILKKVLK